MVRGLEKTYGDKMKFEVVDFDVGDSRARIKKYELGKHGMVITDAEGKKLWAEPGHEQTKAGVEKAIRKVLGS